MDPASLMGIPNGRERREMGAQLVTHSSALSEWGSRGRGRQEEMVFDRSLVLAVERRVTERVVLLLVFFAFRRVTNYLFFLFSHP